jgi:alpha-D-ribose 1-methylphosphonate 5-triphosphate synthase subunit PhnH
MDYLMTSYADYPEDPELALVEFEKAARKELFSLITNETSKYFDANVKNDYLIKVLAFHDAHDLNLRIRT